MHQALVDELDLPSEKRRSVRDGYRVRGLLLVAKRQVEAPFEGEEEVDQRLLDLDGGRAARGGRRRGARAAATVFVLLSLLLLLLRPADEAGSEAQQALPLLPPLLGRLPRRRRGEVGEPRRGPDIRDVAVAREEGADVLEELREEILREGLELVVERSEEKRER